MDAARDAVSISASSLDKFFPPLLTTKDLAGLFRTTPAQIQWLARHGRLPFPNVSLKKRGMLFPRDQVAAWIANPDGEQLKPKRGRPLGSKTKAREG